METMKALTLKEGGYLMEAAVEREGKYEEETRSGIKPGTHMFQVPLHYPRFTKTDYEVMEESKLDRLLEGYGLPVMGDVACKRKDAMETMKALALKERGYLMDAAVEREGKYEEETRSRLKPGAHMFQVPLHYPRFTKTDYEVMEESKLDRLLEEYGLPVMGDVACKRKYAIGAFLWLDKLG
ncbi:hypothetical protein KI387_034626 [Taxus chinensis]|uniref:DUF7722 domain-containing protein n=1 Tax=Taxus chinensis TaxID=29808 RepID=A0AA38C5B3_TAXCH|nr:hypothetical protein KI387_034626 [Taxus chinensis]